MTSETVLTAKRAGRLTKLSVILPALLVGLTFSACVAVGIIGFVNGRNGLEKAAKAELSMLARARGSLMEAKLAAARSDLSNMASGGSASMALNDLNQSLSNFKDDEARIRDYYQAPGSAAAERRELTGEGNKTMYSWRHGELHGSFLSAWKHGGYGEIYVLNPEGMVIYTVNKGADFLVPVTSATLASTGLSQVFNAAKGLEKGEQAVVDFAGYPIDNAGPALFVGEPVFITDFSGTRFAGVLAIRLDVGFFDAVLAQRDGLGETGQAYLARADGTLLSNKPLSPEPTALTEQLDAAAVAEAAGGAEGFSVVVGNDGVERFIATHPIGFLDRQWAVVAEKSADETLASIDTMRNQMIMGTMVTLAVVLVIALFFSRSLTGPLTKLVGALRAIASGDLDTEISAAQRGDEIGEIGRAVLQIRQNAVAEQERRAAEEARNAREESERRQAMLAEIAHDFETSVGKVVETVRQSAARLQESAQEMSTLTQTAGESSTRATDLSNQAMEEVQSIAAASDQLFSSITQISELIARSATVAQTATVRAEATNNTVKSLAEAANRIGEVVTLIRDIADQTNLLALNATIEAARAGEAGRGFAVVASEVKELAAQTGRATGEIQEQIDAIRDATNDAVTAIGEIQNTIREITASVTEVSSAVEEQSAATQGIVDNTQRAAADTATVSGDMQNVRDISARTSEAAATFVSSATDLASQANDLDAEVRGFLAQVRSA